VRVRRAALVAAALALVLPLSGCLAAFLPPPVHSTSTPTGEDVAPDLESYYSQQLVWSGCGDNLQCATASAPLDWSDPQRDSIDLALIRQPATSGTAIGSLLVNPGGPGGSGFDYVRDSVDYATTERLQSAFDVVGFDPRGVNHSTAVVCYTNPSDFEGFLFDLLPGEYGSDEWLAAYEDANKAFAEACSKNTGELLGFVDTISAARDLDLLRAILGDKKLNYLGYSYGTLLGATYADLYPKKTGRLVLDGALDPTTSSFEVSATQAQGFESALRAFLEDCSLYEDCPFSGSVNSSMVDIRALLDRLDASPLRIEDGRELGSSTMTIAIITPLYSKDSWPALRQIFTDVLNGDATYAFQIADFYFNRDPDGSFTNNSTEAFLAINCLDYPSDSSVETMRAEEAELIRLAPVLGKQLAFGGAGCADWPYPPVREQGPIVASGSSDILVVGTINDPATPYVWAKALASQLQNGHLITYDGEGHTAFNKGSSCVDGVIEDYFIDGTVPDSDPRCEPDTN
jgi:pimeloyl-ACP methyl ester carboxylesterase